MKGKQNKRKKIKTPSTINFNQRSMSSGRAKKRVPLIWKTKQQFTQSQRKKKGKYSQNFSPLKKFEKVESEKLITNLIGNSKQSMFDFYCFEDMTDNLNLLTNMEIFNENEIKKAIVDFMLGIILLSLQKLKQSQNGKQIFEKEKKLILITRVLSSLDDNWAFKLLSRSNYNELDIYIQDFLIPSDVFKKKILELSEKSIHKKNALNLAKKLIGGQEYEIYDETIYEVLKKIYIEKGMEKMLAFCFMQIIEDLGIGMNIYMTEIQINDKRKKVKYYDCEKSMKISSNSVFVLFKSRLNQYKFYFGVKKNPTFQKKNNKLGIFEEENFRLKEIKKGNKLKPQIFEIGFDEAKRKEKYFINLNKLKTENMLRKEVEAVNFYTSRKFSTSSSSSSQNTQNDSEDSATKNLIIKEKKKIPKTESKKRASKSFDFLNGKELLRLRNKNLQINRLKKITPKKRILVSPKRKEGGKENNPRPNRTKSKKKVGDIMKKRRNKTKENKNSRRLANQSRSINSSFMQLLSRKSMKNMNFFENLRKKRKAMGNNNPQTTNDFFLKKCKRKNIGSFDKRIVKTEKKRKQHSKGKEDFCLRSEYHHQEENEERIGLSGLKKEVEKVENMIDKNKKLINSLIKKYDVKKNLDYCKKKLKSENYALVKKRKSGSSNKGWREKNLRNIRKRLFSDNSQLNSERNIERMKTTNFDLNHDIFEREEKSEKKVFKNIFGNITNLVDFMNLDDNFIEEKPDDIKKIPLGGNINFQTDTFQTKKPKNIKDVFKQEKKSARILNKISKEKQNQQRSNSNKTILLKNQNESFNFTSSTYMNNPISYQNQGSFTNKKGNIWPSQIQQNSSRLRCSSVKSTNSIFLNLNESVFASRKVRNSNNSGNNCIKYYGCLNSGSQVNSSSTRKVISVRQKSTDITQNGKTYDPNYLRLRKFSPPNTHGYQGRGKNCVTQIRGDVSSKGR